MYLYSYYRARVVGGGSCGCHRIARSLKYWQCYLLLFSIITTMVWTVMDTAAGIIAVKNNRTIIILYICSGIPPCSYAKYYQAIGIL